MKAIIRHHENSMLIGVEVTVLRFDYLPFNEVTQKNPWLDVETPTGHKLTVEFVDVEPLWTLKPGNCHGGGRP